MNTHAAIKALRAIGLGAEVIGSRALRADGVELHIITARDAPTRADAERALSSVMSGQRALLIAETLTPSLRQAALRDDRLVVVADGVVFWERQEIDLDGNQPSPAKHPAGRRPYGRFAVARALLAADGPVTQQELMEDAGIAQAGVSRALRSSFFDEVIDRTWGKIHVVDRETLFERAVSEYPGPGGVTTYWWHEVPVLQQADSVASSDDTALISGDVAADRIRAWRTPEHAVVYTRAEPSLRSLGFSLAEPADYTLMLVYPDDRTIWPTARSWAAPRMVDPMIASFDVMRTGTLGDHTEAVDRIRDYVMRRQR